MEKIKIQVPDSFEGTLRLDKYIAQNQKGMNRSKLKSGILQILINSRKAKLSSKVSAGDIIEFEWEDSVPHDIEKENIPLDIIYEDQNVTVINKKQGMVTHPASGNWSGTLVNALLFHWGKDNIQLEKDSTTENTASLRPGIVHRLDKDTSGVIITARNRDTEEWLGSQFKNHKKLSKIYICICTGHPKTRDGEIKTQIIRDPSDRKRFKAVEDSTQGKFAWTKYHCIACYGPYSLMKVKIETGRTHQIRVHMKYIGCPVLGDPIYSKSSKTSIFADATLMLHAYKLSIRTSKSTPVQTFTAKVPVRFKKALKVLHEKFEKSLPPEKK